MNGTALPVGGITFKSMIRDASISDDTYVPYAMTNRELTEKVSSLLSWTLINSTANVGQSISIPVCNEIMISILDSSGNQYVNIFPYDMIGALQVGANKTGDNLVERLTESSATFYRSTSGTSSYTPTMTIYYR